jgi:hypothetical protein
LKRGVHSGRHGEYMRHAVPICKAVQESINMAEDSSESSSESE